MGKAESAPTTTPGYRCGRCCAIGSPVLEHLATSDVPVTIIYGDRDSVVPSVLSARVADHTPSLAERVVLTDTDHNDPVMFGRRVAASVARLSHKVN